MRHYRADLHIHSCLSACAEIDITPSRIIARAKEIGLDAIAISDHNSAENLITAKAIADREGILLVPAMEITSREEAHILALFEGLEQALEMQSLIYRSLPKGDFSDKDQVYQLVVNEQEEILEFNRRMLFGATALSAGQITDRIHRLGGIAVASHIDRETYSLVSQLGFIPEDVVVDAVELSSNINLKRAKELFEAYNKLPWLRNSDAHILEDIGRSYTTFMLDSLTFKDLSAAFADKERIRITRG